MPKRKDSNANSSSRPKKRRNTNSTNNTSQQAAPNPQASSTQNPVQQTANPPAPIPTNPAPINPNLPLNPTSNRLSIIPPEERGTPTNSMAVTLQCMDIEELSQKKTWTNDETNTLYTLFSDLFPDSDKHVIFHPISPTALHDRIKEINFQRQTQLLKKDDEFFQYLGETYGEQVASIQIANGSRDTLEHLIPCAYDRKTLLHDLLRSKMIELDINRIDKVNWGNHQDKWLNLFEYHFAQTYNTTILNPKINPSCTNSEYRPSPYINQSDYDHFCSLNSNEQTQYVQQIERRLAAIRQYQVKNYITAMELIHFACLSDFKYLITTLNVALIEEKSFKSEVLELHLEYYYNILYPNRSTRIDGWSLYEIECMYVYQFNKEYGIKYNHLSYQNRYLSDDIDSTPDVYFDTLMQELNFHKSLEKDKSKLLAIEYAQAAARKQINCATEPLKMALDENTTKVLALIYDIQIGRDKSHSSIDFERSFCKLFIQTYNDCLEHHKTTGAESSKNIVTDEASINQKMIEKRYIRNWLISLGKTLSLDENYSTQYLPIYKAVCLEGDYRLLQTYYPHPTETSYQASEFNIIRNSNTFHKLTKHKAERDQMSEAYDLISPLIWLSGIEIGPFIDQDWQYHTTLLTYKSNALKKQAETLRAKRESIEAEQEAFLFYQTKIKKPLPISLTVPQSLVEYLASAMAAYDLYVELIIKGSQYIHPMEPQLNPDAITQKGTLENKLASLLEILLYRAGVDKCSQDDKVTCLESYLKERKRLWQILQIDSMKTDLSIKKYPNDMNIRKYLSSYDINSANKTEAENKILINHKDFYSFTSYLKVKSENLFDEYFSKLDGYGNYVATPSIDILYEEDDTISAQQTSLIYPLKPTQMEIYSARLIKQQNLFTLNFQESINDFSSLLIDELISICRDHQNTPQLEISDTLIKWFRLKLSEVGLVHCRYTADLKLVSSAKDFVEKFNQKIGAFKPELTPKLLFVHEQDYACLMQMSSIEATNHINKAEKQLESIRTRFIRALRTQKDLADLAHYLCDFDIQTQITLQPNQAIQVLDEKIIHSALAYYTQYYINLLDPQLKFSHEQLNQLTHEYLKNAIHLLNRKSQIDLLNTIKSQQNNFLTVAQTISFMQQLAKVEAQYTFDQMHLTDDLQNCSLKQIDDQQWQRLIKPILQKIWIDLDIDKLQANRQPSPPKYLNDRFDDAAKLPEADPKLTEQMQSSLREMLIKFFTQAYNEYATEQLTKSLSLTFTTQNLSPPPSDLLLSFGSPLSPSLWVLDENLEPSFNETETMEFI